MITKERMEEIKRLRKEFFESLRLTGEKRLERRKLRMNKVLKNSRRRPNDKEKMLISLFKKNRLPYKYVGNSDLVIGRLNPDFVNINSQKNLIELFGDYWHSEKITKRTKEQEEKKKIEHFAKYGFKTLIIWERELKNMGVVLEKIKRFEDA